MGTRGGRDRWQCPGKAIAEVGKSERGIVCATGWCRRSIKTLTELDAHDRDMTTA